MFCPDNLPARFWQKKIEEKEAKVVFTDKTITKQYEFWRKYNKYET